MNKTSTKLDVLRVLGSRRQAFGRTFMAQHLLHPWYWTAIVHRWVLINQFKNWEPLFRRLQGASQHFARISALGNAAEVRRIAAAWVREPHKLIRERKRVNRKRPRLRNKATRPARLKMRLEMRLDGRKRKGAPSARSTIEPCAIQTTLGMRAFIPLMLARMRGQCKPTAPPSNPLADAQLS